MGACQVLRKGPEPCAVDCVLADLEVLLKAVDFDMVLQMSFFLNCGHLIQRSNVGHKKITFTRDVMLLL